MVNVPPDRELARTVSDQKEGSVLRDEDLLELIAAGRKDIGERVPTLTEIDAYWAQASAEEWKKPPVEKSGPSPEAIDAYWAQANAEDVKSLSHANTVVHYQPQPLQRTVVDVRRWWEVLFDAVRQMKPGRKDTSHTSSPSIRTPRENFPPPSGESSLGGITLDSR